jgi:hypothetical protein
MRGLTFDTGALIALERRANPFLMPIRLRRGEHTVVVAVGARGARALVRARLTAAGFVEGLDYLCAA